MEAPRLHHEPTRRTFAGHIAGAISAAAIVHSCADRGAIANADAGLLKLCDDFIRATNDWVRFGDDSWGREDPYYRTLSRIESDLNGVSAQTMEGVMAKARVAVFKARQPDGSLDFAEAAYWTEQVVQDLFQVHSRS